MPLYPNYNPGFVLLSIVFSILSAYVAVELSSRVTTAQGWFRFAWLLGGGTSMGIGMWSMHYVAMLGFILPEPLAYSVPAVLASLLVAVTASTVALTVVSQRKVDLPTTSVAGMAMGGGISAMHFIGMSAIRPPANCQWSESSLWLSVVFAIAISMGGLFLIFERREGAPQRRFQKATGILLMGAAAPVMHYTGLAAVRFLAPPAEPLAPNSVSITILGTVAISFGAALILSLALVLAIFDRRLTAKKRRIELSDRQHRQLVESVEAILWQRAVDSGVFTLVSSVAETLLGYPVSEWLKDPCFLENHSVAEDRDLLIRQWQETQRTGGPVGFEHRLITASGDTIWLRTSMRAIVSLKGTREIASIMHDVTAQRAVEQELQLQRQYFDALMDSTPYHIFFKSLDSRYIRINKAMATRFGLAHPDDGIGMSDKDFFGEPHASAALAAEQEIISTGESFLSVEEQENWPDGTVSWASTTKMPLYDSDGKISGTMGVSRNITKRKLAELALREKTELLTAVNAEFQREVDSRRQLETQLLQAQKLESIGQLAAGVAHELNTPIQYVGDNCRFLDDSFRGLQEILHQYAILHEAVKAERPAPETLEAIEQLSATLDLEFLATEIPTAIAQSIDGVDRVAQIVRAMKEFSHPRSREMAPIDLNHAIENTLVVCRNEYKYVAQLEVELDRRLPFVYCLAGEINQVVLNLVVNAAHAVKDAHPQSGGLIRVSTVGCGDFVEIRVQDNGTGIPAAIQDRIFEPFFTTKDVGKGSGQGLALARNVAVNKHHGTLTFETKENEGTTFILRIPVGPESREAA